MLAFLIRSDIDKNAIRLRRRALCPAHARRSAAGLISFDMGILEYLDPRMRVALQRLRGQSCSGCDAKNAYASRNLWT